MSLQDLNTEQQTPEVSEQSNQRVKRDLKHYKHTAYPYSCFRLAPDLIPTSEDSNFQLAGTTINNADPFDCSDMGLNEWTMDVTGASYEIAHLLLQNTDIQQTHNMFFSFLHLLRHDQRKEVMSQVWKTRFAEKPEGHYVSATAFVNTYLGGILLAFVLSKFRTWMSRTDDDRDFSNYQRRLEKTWIPYMYDEYLGAVTGTERYLVQKIIDDFLKIDILLPEESYHIAHKLVGTIEVSVQEDPRFVETALQSMDLLLVPDGVTMDPRFTSDEDLLIITYLERLTDFFLGMFDDTRYLQYRDEANWKAFVDKYDPKPITQEWLSEFPSSQNPWILHHFELNYDGIDTRHELRTIDYSGDAIVTEGMFERDSSDNTDINTYVRFRKLPQLNVEDSMFGFFFGYYFVHGFITDDMTTATQVDMDIDEDELGAFFGIIEVRDNNNNVVQRIGHVIPTLPFDTLTNDYIMGYYSKIDEVEFNCHCRVVTGALPAVDDPDNEPRSVWDNGNDEIDSIIGYEQYINRLYDTEYYASEYVDRHFWIPFIFRMLNPRLVSKRLTYPERTSKLTATTYMTSEDIPEIEKYIKDLRNEIEVAEQKNQPEQIASRKKTIEKAEARIKQVRETSANPDTSPETIRDPTDNPPVVQTPKPNVEPKPGDTTIESN